MRHHLFMALSALSLLLCVATATLWVLSYVRPGPLLALRGGVVTTGSGIVELEPDRLQGEVYLPSVRVFYHGLMLVFGLPLLCWCGMSLWRCAARMAGSPQHACRRCGYDLTGNVSGTCPECGTPVPKGC